MTNIKRIANESAEVTAYCLEHRGRCFPNWSDRKIFAYVVFQLTARTCIVTRTTTGKIAGVAFAWPEIESRVRERAAKGEPQFRWTLPTNEGDCLFIAEVIGDMRAAAAMAHWYAAKCPQFWSVPKLTYRRAGTSGAQKLVQLENTTVYRFSYGGLQKGGRR